jgi:hypothetical protein
VIQVVMGWSDRRPHRFKRRRGASPPEDIGGNRRYMEFLEAIRDPHHPGRGALVDRYRGFDPLRYDVDAINDALAALRLPPPVPTAVH